MRSHKLTTVAAAATALLAMAPAGAAAHRQGNVKNGLASSGCRVSLHVEKHVLTSGDAALAFGLGRCGKVPSAGQTVTIYDRAVGASGFSTLGTTITDTKGTYQLPTGALSTNTAFYAVIGAAHSAEREVKVASQVTLFGPAEGKTLLTALTTGKPHAVTFTGSVGPAFENDEVVLERQNMVRGIGWARISKPVKVEEHSGNFSIKHTFRIPGASNIRVLVKANGHNIASPSNELSFTISQAENPLLIIESVQDPVPFEGATTVHGVASGLKSTAITLLAHTVGGSFAPVATSSTDMEGNYSFPVKPSASTLYRVESGGRKSAVLYEGVKYVLTAVTPTSVQSGQPLTITGKVAPAKVGHPVLLQKKNAFGTGFHTVAEGKVEAGGSFTIAETLFLPGEYVFRVKVPGDPENGATATPAFTTTVTPLPASSLPSVGS